MEQKNEILTVMREGFARVDEQFARVDEQFMKLRHDFGEQFMQLRHDFSEQLDGVSDGLHLELKAQSHKLVQRVESVRATVETVDGKLGLGGENVANVMKELARYHATVESPLETRVTNLEGRVWVLEQKK